MVERLLLTKEENGRQLELYETDSYAGELYIDGAWGFIGSESVVKINLYSNDPIFSEDKPRRRRLVTRLVMPTATLFSLRDFLVNQCEKIQEHLGQNDMHVVQLTPEQIANLPPDVRIAFHADAPEGTQKPEREKPSLPGKKKSKK